MFFAPKSKTKLFSKPLDKNQINKPLQKPLFLFGDQGFWGILDGVLDEKKVEGRRVEADLVC